MEMAGGSTFLRSAARGVILHAFLVLLHASLQSDSVEGTLGTGGRSTMEGGFTEFIERDGGKVFRVLPALAGWCIVQSGGPALR